MVPVVTPVGEMLAGKSAAVTSHVAVVSAVVTANAFPAVRV
jgi:hypothetical protein